MFLPIWMSLKTAFLHSWSVSLIVIFCCQLFHYGTEKWKVPVSVAQWLKNVIGFSLHCSKLLKGTSGESWQVSGKWCVEVKVCCTYKCWKLLQKFSEIKNSRNMCLSHQSSQNVCGPLQVEDLFQPLQWCNFIRYGLCAHDIFVHYWTISGIEF